MQCSFNNKHHNPFLSLTFKGRQLRPSEVLNFTSLSLALSVFSSLLFPLTRPPSLQTSFAPPPLTSPCLVFTLSAKLCPRASLPRLPPEHLSDRVCFAALRDEAATPLPIMPLSEPRTASCTSNYTLRHFKAPSTHTTKENTARSVKSTERPAASHSRREGSALAAHKTFQEATWSRFLCRTETNLAELQHSLLCSVEKKQRRPAVCLLVVTKSCGTPQPLHRRVNNTETLQTLCIFDAPAPDKAPACTGVS